MKRLSTIHLSFKVSNVRKERNFSKIWKSTVFDANISQTKKSEPKCEKKCETTVRKDIGKKCRKKQLQQFT